MAFISEDDLREAKIKDLKRLATWLCVTPQPSKNVKEELNLLIFGILRAIKLLNKSPKGTIPSEIKKVKK